MLFLKNDNKSLRLLELRRATIDNYIKLFFVILPIVITIRVIEGNVFHASICIIALLFILGIFFVNTAKNSIYTIPIFSFVVTGLLLAIALFGTENKIFIACIITVHLTSFIIVLQNSLLRMLHIATCFVVYISLFNLLEFGIIECIPIFLVLIGIALVFVFYVDFFEKQDANLSQAIIDANNSSEKLGIVNKTLVRKNQELKTFNQILSHDLKTPLVTINSFSTLLKQEINVQDPKQKEYFDHIERSTKKMNKLINDILSYHHLDLQEFNLEEVPLSSVMSSVEEYYLSHLKEGKLILEHQDLPVVMGNSLLINTVFSNLISNAIKYQPKNKEKHVPKIKIWSTENNTNKEVYIEDNGIGIKEEYVKNLYLPFKRYFSESEYPGSGLGMSICKRVMEKLNGTIDIVSSNNRGTTFKLTFPQ